MEINKTRLAVTVVIVLLIFSGVEIGMKNYFDSRKDHITEEINSNNYDMILIGNSMLGHNVNISILDDELSQLTGRKITSMTFYVNTQSFPLWYLVIKNRIVPSQKSNIPVVIIGHIEEPDLIAIGPRDNITRKYMAVDEPVFYRIRGTPVSITDNLERSFSILFARQDLAAEVLREFIKGATIEQFPDGESVLKERFAIGQFKQTVNKVEPLQPLPDLWNAVPALFTNSSKARTEITENDSLTAGFFPEIIKITKGRFPLVYIDSHLNPVYDNETRRDYRKILSKFLGENNVTYIDLNQREELNDSKLYADLAHFNQKNFLYWRETSNMSGIEINSRIIARELYEQKVIQ